MLHITYFTHLSIQFNLFFQYILKVEHPLPQSYFRQLLSPLIKKNPIPINNLFPFPTFPPIPSPMQLLIYFLFAHSEHFKYMKLYNMWYFVSGFFCLACFQNLSCFSMYQFFYCQRIFLSIAKEYSIVWMYHILCIHSSVDKYQGCAHIFKL